MTRQEILDKTRQVIYDCVPDLADVELDENSVVNTDVGMDSMSFVMVICRLEAMFGVKIPERQWNRLSTLGEVVDAFEKRMNK